MKYYKNTGSSIFFTNNDLTSLIFSGIVIVKSDNLADLMQGPFLQNGAAKIHL